MTEESSHRCLDQAIEEWRPVLGYEKHYEVSDRGRVRSIDRYTPYAGGRPRLRRGKIRALHLCDGYPHVTLVVGRALRGIDVHILVCQAWHGPRPTPDHQVRHKNGIRSDIRPENLIWGTPSENNLDTVKHGRNPSSRKTHCPHGHAYTPDNTYFAKTQRLCRTCRLAANKKWRERNLQYDRQRKRKSVGDPK